LEIEKSVVEFATEAALRYRTIAAMRHDNQVPESFLRSHVASRLHDRFDCPVHVDRLYAAMAIELGGAVTPTWSRHWAAIAPTSRSTGTIARSP
jgi:hypothetical protein